MPAFCYTRSNNTIKMSLDYCAYTAYPWITSPSVTCPLFSRVIRHLRNIFFRKNWVLFFFTFGYECPITTFLSFYLKFLVFKFSWNSIILLVLSAILRAQNFQTKMSKICLPNKYLRTIKSTTRFSRETISSLTIYFYTKLSTAQRALGRVLINEIACRKWR